MVGCAKSGTYVVLTVERGASTAAGVVKVDLSLALAGRSGSGTLSERDGSVIPFPAVVTLDISNGSGALMVTAVARDASGKEVDRGTGVGMVTSGATTHLTVTLGEAMMNDAGADDLTRVTDLAGADLAVTTTQDLSVAGTDLGVTQDLAVAVDMATAPLDDLAVPDDLKPLADMAVHHDLTVLHDLAVLHDLEVLHDLKPPLDMTKTTATLTVNRTGAAAANGSVVGGGINCGTGCQVTVPINTQITLTSSVTLGKGTWFQTWSGGGCSGNGKCVVTMSTDITVSAQFDFVNYMFTLSTPVSGAIAPLTSDVQAAADNICKNAAGPAGLPGTKWAAWISTTSASASGAKNAHDKLTGARGWIRPDGLPFADQAPNGFNDAILYPPNLDENNHLIGANQQVATGSLGGMQSGGNCTDWSASSGAASGGEAWAGSGGWQNSYQFTACSSVRLYCFGTDYNTPVLLPKAAGHVAFLSTNFTLSASSSRATADSICQSDANNNPARIPAGTYQALLALTTEGASVRFSPPAYTGTAPWVRPDGVVVVNTPGDLFNTGADNMLAPIDQLADGSYGGRGTAWTGAADPNATAAGGSSCANWVSTGGSSGKAGFNYLARVKTTPAYFDYAPSPQNCTSTSPVYCLQVN
jgi:hypothetical protein